MSEGRRALAEEARRCDGRGRGRRGRWGVLKEQSAPRDGMAATGLAMMGEQASRAGPALAKQLLVERSFRVRRNIAEALTFIAPKAADVEPALLQTLRADTDADVCR